MPGHLRTGGYLRHVQPMVLRDGITEWARTFFQEEDRVIKYPLPEAPYMVDGFLAAVFERHTSVHSLTVPSNSSRTIGLWYGLIYTTFCYRYSFSWSSSTVPTCLTQLPLALFGGRGEVALADP